MTTAPAAAAAPAAAPAPPQPPAPPGPPATGAAGIEVHAVRFTGTGGGYFRVWIVNLVLMILSFGLYTPWARRRTARWFYDHTEVAGSPLEFAAPMRRMVFGFFVFAALYVAYEIASRTGQDVMAFTMLAAGVALAPMVWQGAMRFRLASTRWRGLQLRFSATRPEVYRASWPLAAIGAIWAAVVAAGMALDTGDAAERAALLVPLGAVGLVALIASALLYVRLEYGYRRLLFERGGLGDVAGRFKPGFGAYLRISLIAGGAWAAIAVALGAAGFLLAGGPGDDPSAPAGPAVAMAAAFGVLVALLAVAACAVPLHAWREASLFALVWNGAGLGRIVRTQCTLSAARFTRMRVANVLLTVVTLGLWRPFARVREYRMKVESVRLHVRGGLDSVTGRLQAHGGGVGDMLADAAGLDLIG